MTSMNTSWEEMQTTGSHELQLMFSKNIYEKSLQCADHLTQKVYSQECILKNGKRSVKRFLCGNICHNLVYEIQKNSLIVNRELII